VFIVGVGMTAFLKPGKHGKEYFEFAKEAGTRALEDACISYKDIEQVVVGHVYGDSCAAQRAVYELGMTGVPVMATHNNCATGSSAVFLARQAVLSGMVECAMALGFEKMNPGSLGLVFQDRTPPLDKHMMALMDHREFTPAPPASQFFGAAGLEHMEKYGTKPETFSKIAVKSHRNSTRNPYAQFQDEYNLEQVMNSPAVYGDFLNKLSCCPTSDGGGCVILASEDFVVKNGLQGQAVEIIGQSMKTDQPDIFDSPSDIKLVGFDMSRSACEDVYKQANIQPSDVQVCELHDCFSPNELITYEALKFCDEGKAEEFIEKGHNDYGGKVVVNPSGGLISKGHALGASGQVQLVELCWQLRGECGPRQVKDAKVGLAHNLGLGGACVVTALKRPEAWTSMPMKRKQSLAMGPPAEAKL
ncbi:Sterol carrier protein 2 (SCP-2) (Acetyl-CoA C-myristoyltransferase) (Non-specific lipid-transfer protein) (NSL-TP) (Propanoyl-CoA C-acyltransferase) (SCP-2/3-oxoacyl-CoA thiolase) (SCP-2/thiolase) (SCP-chi) (SCPX) (Sterol carrier protein X) (SCP-X), partial [Durusdinium trenchii]